MSTAGEALLRDGTRWRLAATGGKPSRALGLVPALDKALAILEHLNRPLAEPRALPDIVRATGITKSHAHAILKTLVAHDWLVFDDATKTYRLSAGVLAYVSSAIAHTGPLTVVRERLSELAHTTRMPVMLAKPLEDGSFVVLDKFSADHVLEISFPLGYRFPRDACAHMRAHLAWRSETEIEAWLQRGNPRRYTAQSLTAPDAIRAEIARTRERGYARSVGEFTDGLTALAVPILDATGSPAYVVSCASLSSIMADEEERVAGAMVAAVAGIHATLGIGGDTCSA